MQRLIPFISSSNATAVLHYLAHTPSPSGAASALQYLIPTPSSGAASALHYSTSTPSSGAASALHYLIPTPPSGAASTYIRVYSQPPAEQVFEVVLLAQRAKPATLQQLQLQGGRPEVSPTSPSGVK